MTVTHCWFRTLTAISSFAIMIVANACDPTIHDTARLDVADGEHPSERGGQAVEWGVATVPKIAAEFANLLVAEAGGPAGIPPGLWKQCKFDTFQFHLPEDGIAITTPPGGFFTPFPAGIPTFDDPVLADAYIFVVTMRDVHGKVVGYASEQEVVDLVKNESKTSYTLTLPARGTLMLTQLESFQVLIDAVDEMVADGEFVRTFDPPIVEVLTLPGTGRVVGGSEEFKGAIGLMQEIGVIHKIDLINNEFELTVIVQALHC